MSKIVCFDTETTGTSPTQDELIQITIVDENCHILLESYIKPKERTSWINAQQVNHISPKMVADAPTARELAPQIQKIFDEADYIIGYNTTFDTGFVKRDCKIKIDEDKIVDCLKIFRDECKKKKVSLPRHKLGNAIDFYCPEAKEEYLLNAHDASCDAIATMKVYLAQIDKDRERHYDIVDSLPDHLLQLLDERVPPVDVDMIVLPEIKDEPDIDLE